MFTQAGLLLYRCSYLQAEDHVRIFSVRCLALGEVGLSMCREFILFPANIASTPFILLLPPLKIYQLNLLAMFNNLT